MVEHVAAIPAQAPWKRFRLPDRLYRLLASPSCAEYVRAALPFIADKGSFTLVSSVLTDEYIQGGAIATAVSHLVEGFLKRAAAELPRPTDQLHRSDGPVGVGGLPRLFPGFHSRASLGSRPDACARDVDTNHGAHPQAAQDELIMRAPRDTFPVMSSVKAIQSRPSCLA